MSPVAACLFLSARHGNRFITPAILLKCAEIGREYSVQVIPTRIDDEKHKEK